MTYTLTLSKAGWNSLMVASLNGHSEVVERLLCHGAFVDQQVQVRRNNF